MFIPISESPRFIETFLVGYPRHRRLSPYSHTLRDIVRVHISCDESSQCCTVFNYKISVILKEKRVLREIFYRYKN